MKNRPGEYRGGVPLPRQQLKQLQQRKSKPANKKPAEKREKPPKPQKERKEPKPATDAPLTRLGLSPAERINVHVAVLGLQEANGGGGGASARCGPLRVRCCTRRVSMRRRSRRRRRWGRCRP